MNYYNEIDAFAAAWLKRLIDAGKIPAGHVDTRSIEDVTPNDLRGYTQCHFFAGIGGWPLALQLAGWPADRPVWTGSCPCQPFSAAGKGEGFADQRHLWPAFYHLISQCSPQIVFGEQVASADGLTWLDLVREDLENEGRIFAAVDLCAAGVGAPHIRQRLYWMAYANRYRLRAPSVAALHDGEYHLEPRGDFLRLADTNCEQWNGSGVGGAAGRTELADGCTDSGLADSESGGRGEECAHARGRFAGNSAQRLAPGSMPSGADSGLADTVRSGLPYGEQQTIFGTGRREEGRAAEQSGSASTAWSDCEWIACRDGKARPAQPGSFPLAYGVPHRVGLLKGYGNAIVPQLAAEFIREAYIAVQNEIGWPQPLEEVLAEAGIPRDPERERNTFDMNLQNLTGGPVIMPSEKANA